MLAALGLLPKTINVADKNRTKVVEKLKTHISR
jgi:hypothetical protein